MSAIDVIDKRYYAKYAPTGIGNYFDDPSDVLVTLHPGSGDNVFSAAAGIDGVVARTAARP